MKFKHNLLKYRLIGISTGKVIGKTIKLTETEADRMNYAYSLNGSGVKYERV